MTPNWVINRGAVVFVTVLVVTGMLVVTPGAAATPPESEPNDTQSTAESVSFGEEVTGEVSTEDDEDWYAIDVEAGESINVSVTGISGRVFVQLRDSDEVLPGDLVTNGKYVGAGETKHFGGVASSDTTLYLRVYYTTGSYSFEATSPANDEREYDGDQGNATRIQLGQQVSGQVTINDRDWYAIDLDAGESIRMEVSVPEDAPDRVFVEFRNETDLVERPGNRWGNGRYVNPGETLPLGAVIAESGTYYVEVSYGRGPYSLTIEEVTNDPEDPNEQQATATPLFENPLTPTGGRLTYNDQDWFVFPAQAGETLSLTASMRANATGAAFIELRNESVTVGSQTGTGAFSGTIDTDRTVSVTGTANVSGQHYLRVYYGEGTPVETYVYDLRVGGERYGPPNDRFERPNPPIGNQDRANATDIDPGTYADLAIVDDDRDVFAVELDAGERLVANASFAHAENDLALALTDDSGATVAQADSATDDERLRATVGSAGTYYLAVTGQAGAATTYALEVSVVEGATVTADAESEPSDPDAEETPTDTGGFGVGGLAPLLALVVALLAVIGVGVLVVRR